MRIFLSAVSDQFKDCRDALASDLRAVGADVKVQEDFQQHGRTLLEKLEGYIAGCDRVIALVGDAYGAEPGAGALAAGTPRRSYTQWEYFFAQGERLGGSRKPRKDIFVYFASPDFLAQHPVAQAADAAQLQQDFVGSIRRSGEDRNPFGSLHELRALVLRDGFRLPHDGEAPAGESSRLSDRRAERRYRERVIAEHATVSILGRSKPLDLESIYIALRVGQYVAPELLPDESSRRTSEGSSQGREDRGQPLNLEFGVFPFSP